MVPEGDVLGPGATLPIEAETRGAEGVQPGDTEGQEEAREPSFDDLADRVVGKLEARITAFQQGIRGELDQHYQGTQGLVNRLADQLNRELGGNRDSLTVLQEIIEGMADPEAVTVVKNRAKIARLERQQEEATRRAQQRATEYAVAPAAGMTQDQWQQVFTASVLPAVDAYAINKGFNQQEIEAASWQDRLLVAGAPGSISDVSNVGIELYKAAVYRAIDKLAAQRTRPRTKVDTTRGAGTGNVRFTLGDIAKMTPAEIAKNEEAIFAQMGIK